MVSIKSSIKQNTLVLSILLGAYFDNANINIVNIEK